MTTPLPIPTISTEPVASVLRILSLKENGDDSFIARSLPQVRRVYGGQVLAQGLLAASATVPIERLPILSMLILSAVEILKRPSASTAHAFLMVVRFPTVPYLASKTLERFSQ